MLSRAEPAVRFLLTSADPSVRYFTLFDLLETTSHSHEATTVYRQILTGPRVTALLDGQHIGTRHSPDSLGLHPGGFGAHPYKKWDGAHWRLVSLVELGLPAHEPHAVQAADQVLHWLTSNFHRSKIKAIDGRVRRCASQEGNALAVCSRLGLTDDPRVQYLAASLIAWQWPDGGWNCDKRPSAQHSSFYESLSPLWGLIEYYRATWEPAALRAAQRTVELFLNHRLFRSTTTGDVIKPEWLKLHYPLYWHYDILQALLILARFDELAETHHVMRDPRVHEALDLIEAKRRPDGCWHAEGYYWAPLDKRASNVDVVDWGRRGPNEMITLNALRVLKAAGRL